MNPKEDFHNTSYSVQLPYIAGPFFNTCLNIVTNPQYLAPNPFAGLSESKQILLLSFLYD